MKVLITGISGFAGSFLAEYLLKKKLEIFGTYIERSSPLNLKTIEDELNLLKLDLLDSSSVLSTIGKVKPDYIFHLAALTSPKDSFESPYPTIENNIKAQLNILESLHKLDMKKTKILIVSSAEIYGLVNKEDLPINEHTEFRPTNPYAVSKLAQDFLGLQYFLSYGLEIVRVRPFNHIGPRQSDNFVVGRFAKKIAEIEKGNIEPTLKVGNLEAKRDFTDVRDMVRAYFLAIEKGKSGEVYNLGSGTSYKISEVLEKLINMSKKKISIEEDSSLLRPSDNPELVCDFTKFKNLTGWSPEISIEQTLQDTLEYWRNII